MAYKKSSRTRSKLHPRHLFWVGLVIALALIGLLVFKHLRTSDKDQPVAEIPSAQHSDDSQTSKADHPVTPTTTPTPNDKTAVISPPNASHGPTAPSGSFVSSHKISRSQASDVESSCYTTSNTHCFIKFSNDQGVVRYLTPQTTDSTGYAYWTWSADTAKLDPGSWHVSATATLNNQSKTTADPQPLEVTP
jgi:hypothetical protein